MNNLLLIRLIRERHNTMARNFMGKNIELLAPVSNLEILRKMVKCILAEKILICVFVKGV